MKVFNLGTMTNGGSGGVGIVFNGKQGGTSGIEGGLLFSSGSATKFSSGAFKITDVEDMEIPLVWSTDHGNALLGPEGVHDTRVGVVPA